MARKKEISPNRYEVTLRPEFSRREVVYAENEQEAIKLAYERMHVCQLRDVFHDAGWLCIGIERDVKD